MISAHSALAEQGFAVFPIIANDKKPLTDNGLLDASTNQDQIERWTSKWPKANWAIRTDGLLVVDIDQTPDSPNAWLTDDADKLLDLAAAPMVITPRGGKHYYFQAPAGSDYRNTQSELAPKVDTRANGGYVLCPPSIVDGKAYQWVNGEPEGGPESLPLPPQWLLDMLAKKPARQGTATAPDKIGEGQRNAVLFRLACSLRRPGLSEEEICAALKAANVKRCNPPLDEREIERIAKSAINYDSDRATVERIEGKGKGKSKRPAARPIIVNLADVEAEETEWLWKDHIPVGELTCIAGYQGLGKSFLTIDIIARVTTGKPWPGTNEAFEPGGVVLLSAEDDLARTIRPRLDAAEADVSRINAIQGVAFIDDDREADFSLQDLPALELAIQQTPNCRLVVIDPVSCYMGGVDTHKNDEVRSVLMPLRELAERYRVAVVFVTHVNRSETKVALDRVMGSGAFTAAPRVAWLVAKDKDDELCRLFLQMKNNLGPNPGGLAFQIIDRIVGGKPRGVVQYKDDRIDLSCDEALGPTENKGPTLLDTCCDWLKEFLSDGEKLKAEVDDAAEGNGYNAMMLKRAKTILGVASRKVGFGPAGQWYWSLPGSTLWAKEVNEKDQLALSP